nr:MAG TPA: putative DnaG-like primase [Caudoviricetes sp.]
MADAPWLTACKRLAVGQTARFRCCGRTPAGVLYNKPDAWELWCHRCKTYAKEPKQFVSLVQPEVLPRVLPAPAQLISISHATPETKAHVYGFMVSKGLMPDMLEDALWSEELRRMVFRTQAGTYLARALYENQQPKWLMLGGAQSYAVAAPAKALDAPVDAELVVLTEDYLSARKVQYAASKYSQMQVVATALLGTRLQLPLKSKLVQANKPVLLMLDGDAAGDAGTARISKELRPFVPVRSYQLPGLDPKDMQVHQILEGLKCP